MSPSQVHKPENDETLFSFNFWDRNTNWNNVRMEFRSVDWNSYVKELNPDVTY